MEWPDGSAPRCEREFGKVNQAAHVCVPGITVEELLSRHPGWVGEICAAVLERLRRVGPVHEDAVNVGVFLKCGSSSSRTSFPSGSRIRAIARWMSTGAHRIVHVINLTGAEHVDDQLGLWLEESTTSTPTDSWLG